MLSFSFYILMFFIRVSKTRAFFGASQNSNYFQQVHSKLANSSRQYRNMAPVRMVGNEGTKYKHKVIKKNSVLSAQEQYGYRYSHNGFEYDVPFIDEPKW